MKTYAEGVIFMPPDGPKLSGKKTIATWQKTAYFDPFNSKLQMKLGHADVFGTQAFITGSFNLEMTPKAGGNTLKGTGKHMALLKKQKDGSWRYAKAIWNFDKPPA
jgi:ketosteroid isomerase-like protein